jgi:hypothetical protein
MGVYIVAEIWDFFFAIISLNSFAVLLVCISAPFSTL